MAAVEVQKNGMMLDLLFKGVQRRGQWTYKRIDLSGLLAMEYDDGIPFGLAFQCFIARISDDGRCEYELNPRHEAQVRALEPFDYHGQNFTFEQLVEHIYAENKAFYDAQKPQ